MRARRRQRGIALVGGMLPGTTGTPASPARRRAAIFEPIRSMTAAGGPMKASPAASQAAANSAFSERNP